MPSSHSSIIPSMRLRVDFLGWAIRAACFFRLCFAFLFALKLMSLRFASNRFLYHEGFSMVKKNWLFALSRLPHREKEREKKYEFFKELKAYRKVTLCHAMPIHLFLNGETTTLEKHGLLLKRTPWICDENIKWMKMREINSFACFNLNKAK